MALCFRELRKIGSELQPCFRVYIVMPLFQPYAQVQETSEDWFQPLWFPAFLCAHSLIEGSQCPSLLQMGPPGPPEDGCFVGISTKALVEYEAFLRNIQPPAKPPVV